MTAIMLNECEILQNIWRVKYIQQLKKPNKNSGSPFFFNKTIYSFEG